MTSKKMNLVMDLDNTLISAEPIEKFPFDDKDSWDKVKNLSIYNMDDYYIVFGRPHIQEFLDYAFENFNVSVWTAASKSYAVFIIDNVILEKSSRKLDFIFFSDQCSVSNEKHQTSKKLKMLWETCGMKDYDYTNTIIIDDLKSVNEAQICNSIRVKAYEILDKDSEKDTYLKELMKKLEVIRKKGFNGSCLNDV
jgi:hypothetical protein